MGSRTNQSAIVRLDGVCKSFAPDSLALRDICLEVGAGETVALIGANGSGKSTLLRAIAGECDFDAGKIETFATSPHPPSRELRSRLAYIRQQVALDPEMTGKETLELFAALHGIRRPEAEARLRGLTERFGLSDELTKKVSDLSGGFRQRLHLATGLVHSPELVLADEATAALDPSLRAMVWDYFRELADQGAAMLIASHDLIEAERGCDRIVMLARGEKILDAPPAEVIADHGLPMLQAECEEAVDPAAAKSIPGLESVTVRGNQLTALVRDRPVKSVLEALGPVRSYRCENPSLATAYAKLSGQALGETHPHGNGGRGRPGGRRR